MPTSPAPLPPDGRTGNQPPPTPPDEDARRGTGGSRARWWVTGAIVAVVVTAAVIVLAAMHWHPARSSKQARFICQNNLQQIAGLFVEAGCDRAWRPRPGPALLLDWRKSGRWIARGQESILVCPCDEGGVQAVTPDSVARYDTVDLDDPPADLCTYAVRDFARFPLEPSSIEPEPIAACVGRFRDGKWSPSHNFGLIVAFSDGSARFLGWDELGLGDGDLPDTAPIVGPGSPTPLLRGLCFRPGVTAREEE